MNVFNLSDYQRRPTAPAPATPLPPPTCGCEACYPMDWANPTSIRMIVCATCGNKRCPHATDHRHACNSNEPGQPGSSYAVIRRWETE